MKNDGKLPFGKKNYTLMLVGIAVITLGFVLMGMDKEEFGFGILGLTISPIVILIGFGLQFFAILQTPEKTS